MKLTLVVLLVGILIAISSPWIAEKLPVSGTDKLVSGVTDITSNIRRCNTIYWAGLSVAAFAFVRICFFALDRSCPRISRSSCFLFAVQIIQMIIAYIGVGITLRAAKGELPLLSPPNLLALLALILAWLLGIRRDHVTPNDRSHPTE